MKEKIAFLAELSKIFDRFLRGKADASEEYIVKKTSKIINKGKNSPLSKEQSEIIVNRVYQNLATRFGFKYDIDTKPAIELPSNSNKKSMALRYFVSAAAAILLIISGGLWYFQSNGGLDTILFANSTKIEQQFFAADSIMHITLPDGSLITLNKGSLLSYSSMYFNKNRREIHLEGEAFFEVKKNEKKPFIVHSGNIQTIVKGTSFNIKAYKELSNSTISVREGKVEIKAEDKTLDVLTANKQLVYDKQNSRYISEDKPWEDSSGWMNGEFQLNHADVTELQLRIKQHFDIDLVVHGDALKGMALESSFAKGSNIDSVLKSICLLYNVKYKLINDRQVEIYK